MSESAAEKASPSGREIAHVALTFINRERLSQGLRPLTLHEELCWAAQEHAEDMAARDYFDFMSPEGLEIGERARRSGYPGKIGASLNRGTDSAEEVVGLWLGDGQTRKSLLGPEYRHIGIGVASGRWAVLLGTPALAATRELFEEVLGLVNDERRKAGAPALELSPQLGFAAQAHAADMARRRFFDPRNPDGLGTEERVKAAGYEGSAAENLIRGALSAAEALCSWLSSEEQRTRLLDPGARHMGIGVAESIWVQIIGVPSAPAAQHSPELVGRLLALINGAREQAGLSPLRLSEALGQAAQGHSEDMAGRKFFAYEAPDGAGVARRVRQSGYRGRILPAITMGQRTPEAVMEVFLRSEGHRKNLLDPEMRHLGVGVCESRWTLIEGAPPAEISPEVMAGVLDLINGERLRAGAAPLVLSSPLNQAAQAHAADMALRGYFDFRAPDGESVSDRASKAGFTGRTMPAITRGQGLPESAVAVWLRSEGNRQNLLDPAYTLLGVGVSDSNWTIILGTPA